MIYYVFRHDKCLELDTLNQLHVFLGGGVVMKLANMTSYNVVVTNIIIIDTYCVHTMDITKAWEPFVF